MRLWLRQLFHRLQWQPRTRRMRERIPARKSAPRPSLLWLEDRVTPAVPFLVADINPIDQSYPKGLVEMNGVLFFTADDGTHGRELWKSDGTESGTALVKDILPGPYAAIYAMTVMNGTLFFVADDGVHGTELWKSDGTEAGTVLVKDINPGPGGSMGYLTQLADVNGVLFFAASSSDDSTGLWKTDGTETGTVLVKDSVFAFYPTAVNGMLFFSAADDAHGAELWKSDGTEAGTVIVKDISPGFYSSGPRYLTDVDGTLFFAAFDQVHSLELWKSDGTEAGTVLVKDINTDPGPYGQSSYLRYLTDVNGTLFFSADDGTHGRELWKSDGTESGTVMVKDIFLSPYPYGHSYPRYLTAVNGELFFVPNDGEHGRELWKSDGTESGTVLVKDIFPAAYGSIGYYSVPINVNGTLFFEANDGVHGAELWKSDGTENGTVLAGEVIPGEYGGSARFITNVGSLLFFTAADQSHGAELWALDINNSPVLDTAPVPMLPAIPILGMTLPGGGLVSDLTENVSDADPGTAKGIAVVAIDSSHGKWQYNLTGVAGGWTDIPSVSPTNALLLADDGNTRVRFVPARAFQGFASITYKAWDQTNRAAEGTFDDTTDVVDSSYSAATERGWIAVGKTTPPVNADGATVLPATKKDKVSKPALVRDVLGIAGLESAPKTNLGMAITFASTATGTWQYRLAGTTQWVAVGSVSAENALLLRPADEIRFVPASGVVGSATLTFKTWDLSVGTAGTYLPAVGDAFGTDSGNAVIDIVP